MKDMTRAAAVGVLIGAIVFTCSGSFLAGALLATIAANVAMMLTEDD